MKALRSWLWAGALVLLALPAVGQSVFSHPVAESPERRAQVRELAEAMRAQESVQGRFTQTKHLEILSEPLVSRGHFALDAQGEFLWDIREPFPLSYQFREGELTRVQDGEEQRLSPADEPGLHGFFQFFSALFELTDRELAKRFERYFERDGVADAWTLGLRPRDRRMGEVLEQLVVRGNGALIERVILTEPGGDRTELRFHYEPDGN